MTKKNMRYEKPNLTVLFDNLPAAMGQCTAGIGNSSACAGGTGGMPSANCTGGSGGAPAQGQ
jgi:hypothetical protein